MINVTWFKTRHHLTYYRVFSQVFLDFFLKEECEMQDLLPSLEEQLRRFVEQI